MGPRNSPGPDITLAMSGNQATHLSLLPLWLVLQDGRYAQAFSSEPITDSCRYECGSSCPTQFAMTLGWGMLWHHKEIIMGPSCQGPDIWWASCSCVGLSSAHPGCIEWDRSAQSLFLRLPALLECLEVAVVELMGLTWDIISLLLLVMFLQWYLGTSQWDDYSINDDFWFCLCWLGALFHIFWFLYEFYEIMMALCCFVGNEREARG